MAYDPWELEGRMRERQRQLRVEIERMRRLALWRARDDADRDGPSRRTGRRTGRHPVRRAVMAVLRVLRRDDVAAPRTDTREERGEG